MAAQTLHTTCAFARFRRRKRKLLDLSSWRIAFNGAEPVRAATLHVFSRTFAECGFRPDAFFPCYGLAEATLMVSGISRVFQSLKLCKFGNCNRVESWMLPPSENAGVFVSCGRPVPGEEVLIVDPDTKLECKPSQTGEIWVAGLCVAQGYWEKPRESNEALQQTARRT